MSNTDRYFQSRLCILAYGSDIEERLQTLCSDSFIEAGNIAWKRLSKEHQDEHRQRLLTKHADVLIGSNRGDDRIAAMLGAEITNVQAGHISTSFERRNAFARFRREYEDKHGPDAPFRIRTDLFWDVATNHKLSYRDASIFIAILSSVGSKSGPVCIRHDMIAARAMGYKSPAIMQAEIRSRADGAIPFTRSQVRSTVDKLHALGMFARCYPGDKEHRSRSTFYSTRMTNDELRAAVMKRRLFVAEFKAKEAAANAQLRQAIDTKLAAVAPITVAKSPPITVAIVAPKSPESSQTIATASPEGSPLNRQSVATIIKAPLVEPHVIETPPVQPPERRTERSLPEGGKAERAGAPTKTEVAKHFEALLVGGKRYAQEYIKTADWTHSDKPWRESGARWLFDRVNKAKRQQRAKALA